MNGMIGLSGVGSPGTIFVPPAGTSICVVALIDLPCARGDEGASGYRSRARRGAATDRHGPDRGLRQALPDLPRRERPRQGAIRRGCLDGAAAGGAGADPLLRRARPRVRRPAPRRVRRRVARRRDLARREALLHRPARRAQPAGARRDVLQLGDQADPAAQLLRQRPGLRPRGDLDRVHRVRPADLPQLLPERRRRARVLRAALPRLRLEPAVRRPRPRPRPRAARPRGTARRTVDAPRAELPDPGAAALPSTATRPPTCSASSSTATRSFPSSSRSCTTRTAGSSWTRSCSTRSRSTSSARSRAPTSWSTWRCRPATSSSCAR